MEYEKLKEFSESVLSLFRRLQFGDLNFSWDKLYCAMKCSPCEIFSDNASKTIMSTEFNKPVKREDVQSDVDGLKAFKEEFQVDDNLYDETIHLGEEILLADWDVVNPE